MKVAAFQMDIAWEDPKTNRAKIEHWLSLGAAGADLVVFPEMFTTGFSMHPADIAEDMRGESVAWLADTARRFGKALMGSMAIKTESVGGTVGYYNRLFFVDERACQADQPAENVAKDRHS